MQEIGEAVLTYLLIGSICLALVRLKYGVQGERKFNLKWHYVIVGWPVFVLGVCEGVRKHLMQYIKNRK